MKGDLQQNRPTLEKRQLKGEIMLRLLAVGVVALAVPCVAFASPTVQSVSGEVTSNGAPVFAGQPLLVEANIVTAQGGKVLLSFEDGMSIAVNENSRLRIVDFRFTRGPNDRAVIDLLQGAARVSTGEISRRNPRQFFFRTPQAQFGVQGPSDFSVVLVNPAYLTVNAGSGGSSSRRQNRHVRRGA